MAKVTGADTVLRNLRNYDVRYKATVRNVLAREAEVIQQRMKAEHRWANRTGNAEAGLHAGVLEQGQTFTIRAQHGVPYGKYLETRSQGRYAVLQPTIRSQWPRTLKRVAEAVKAVKAT